MLIEDHIAHTSDMILLDIRPIIVTFKKQSKLVRIAEKRLRIILRTRAI